MARRKTKTVTSKKMWIPFKTKNRLGREGCKRAGVIKLPNSNFWASLRVALRRMVGSRELYLRICNHIKTSSHLLIKIPDTTVLVEAGWSDANRLKNLIHQYLPKVSIKRVMKVNNPYIAGMYEIKKEEYRSRYKTKNCGSADPLKEEELLHSTRESSVDEIVTNNLNWRLVWRCRYGLGNCFSSDADYANCHANRRNGENRAFIVCKVLVGRTMGGSSGLETLPDDYDTAVGGPTNKEVYVKFDDNEFLPQYVVYYKAEDKYISESKYYRC